MTMTTPAMATNGRRLPILSERNPPERGRDRHRRHRGQVGGEDDADSALLVEPELGDEVERQERGDAGVSEHHEELGEPRPAEVGVLARIEHERAEEHRDGELLCGLLGETPVLEGQDEHDHEDQRDHAGNDEALEVTGEEVHQEAPGEDADRSRDAMMPETLPRLVTGT